MVVVAMHYGMLYTKVNEEKYYQLYSQQQILWIKMSVYELFLVA